MHQGDWRYGLMPAADAEPGGAATPYPAGRPWAEWTAVATLFALLGVLGGNWVARIPAAADAVGAGPGLLGLVLLGTAVGSVLTMPFVGRLCQRRSSTVVAAWLGVAASASLPLLGLAALTGSPALLAVALAVYGATNGGLDVSMNANAVAAVRRARRPLMPGFHAVYSVGGMFGAGTGGLAAATGLGLVVHFSGVAAIGIAATLLVARRLAPDPPDGAGAEAAGGIAPAPQTTVDDPTAAGSDPTDRNGPGGRPGRPVRPPGRRRGRRLDGLLLVFGAVAFCSALGEGAMADWTALFLRDVLHASDAAAATGFAAFSVAMAASRFSGTAALRRWDPAVVLVGGCLLAAAGTLLAAAAPTTALAVVGFAAVGAGLSFGFPVALNAAGAHRLGSGPAIGVVTTIGYTGFLAGPPLIGLLAELAGLRIGLTAVAAAAGIGALLALRWRDALRRHDPSRTPTPTAAASDEFAPERPTGSLGE